VTSSNTKQRSINAVSERATLQGKGFLDLLH